MTKSRNKREGFYHSCAEGKHSRTKDIYYRLSSKLTYFDIIFETRMPVTKFKDCWCMGNHYNANGVDDTVNYLYPHLLRFKDNLCEEVML